MAQDVIARVHLVAEKLQQKAQDAQKKGNEAAARSLTSSVSDLRQALALISEQRHLLALRHGESDDAIDDNMEELTSRLTKVQTMLIKKSEDMKVKGNVTARTALQQAAETVTQARMRILKQQQTLFGFSERWKMLETAGNYDTKYKNNEETLVERVQRLVELEHVVLEVWPEYEIEELKNAILRSREIENDMKRVKGRAKERQEEDAALLEQQREACQAMEQLVRESDQEIQHVTRKAAEERQTLKLKLESLTLENERLKHDHDEEVIRLKRQLTSAMDVIEKIKMDQMKELKVEIIDMVEEKEEMATRYIDEVNKLHRQLEHLQANLVEKGDIDESQGKETAKVDADEDTKVEQNKESINCDTLEHKVEEKRVALEDKLKLLQNEVNGLRSEKEDITKSYLDEVTKLRKVFTDEIEELQSQIERMTASFKLNEKTIGKNNELQALRDEVKDLHVRNERLKQSHVDELEQLRQNHLNELEDLRLQLDQMTVDSTLSTSLVGNELQQLQAEIGALTIEKDRLVKEHTDTIENLNSQVKDNRAEQSQNEHLESSDEEVGDMNDHIDVPILELDEDEIQYPNLPAEDEVDRSCSIQDDSGLELSNPNELDTQSANYDEHLRAQILRLNAEVQLTTESLLKEKREALDEVQHTHKVEICRLEASFNTLQAQISEFEARCQRQQSTILTLQDEQVELEHRIELLTTEKTETITLQSMHEDEITRLNQSVVDREKTVNFLSNQVKELESALAAKSAEENDATASLERCEATLKDVRLQLDDQMRKCGRLQSEVQEAQDSNEESEKYLVQLRIELCEMTTVLMSLGENLDIVSTLTDRMWHCQEAADLCGAIVSVLSNVEGLRDQLRTMKMQLNDLRREGEKHEFVFNQFVQSLDWRLFAKDGDDKELVKKNVESDTNFDDLLSDANTNCAQWLNELQQLRDGIETYTIKIQTLEQEKQRIQEQFEKAEDSRHELEVVIESLNECIADSASLYDQQQQTLQQQEVVELQQQLTNVRNEFERYRVRSHTALKKMEKRAELLNGMRRENEVLIKQVEKSSEEREQADAARRTSKMHLNQVQETLEMMQVEFNQFAVEKSCIIAELEEETQRLIVEKERLSSKNAELTIKIEELMAQKQQMEDESKRVKEAERTALQTRLNAATAAIQTATDDLQTAHDALGVSKAECDKRQRRIEALEQQLKASYNALPSEANAHSIASTDVPSADSKIVVGNAKQLTDLRASETALRQQLEDARVELTSLQERFVTTKAANADKIFVLEEQSRKLELELAVAMEEKSRLISELKSTRTAQNGGGTLRLINQVKSDDSNNEVSQLRSALNDATTEIALLTRALDACRDELQEVRDPINAESEKESVAVTKISAVLHAKDDALKRLRKQVLGLQEEVQTLSEEKTAFELKAEQDELEEIQATRKHLQSEKERAMQTHRRQTLVLNLSQQIATVVNELQARLEDHSSAYRSVCEFRDDNRAVIFPDRTVEADVEYEECLVMRSGVVIKAGANFQLPVFCEQSGWCVVWSFSIKEEAADVLFKLTAKILDRTSTEVEIVSPERINDMSGSFLVQHDGTTLVFEWDNAFSWLNEKTLDYHVSIQEPLTVQIQQVRRTERELKTRLKRLNDGLVLIQEEAKRRYELVATLQRLEECEAMKEIQLTELKTRRTKVMEQKVQFQEEMDGLKADLAVLLAEQDELEDIERRITKVWNEAMTERDDVEMTLQLAGNGAQMESLAHELNDEIKVVRKQLACEVKMDEVVINREDDNS
ncbi:putative GOLD domain superfamily protein [Plasmopara halstedii]